MLVTSINKKQLITSLLIPLLVGGLATAINFSGFQEFQSLNQPALTPPPWVFSVVWTILYALMGLSFYLIYESEKANKTLAYSFYAAQLFLNFLWTFIFFTLDNYSLSLFVIILLLVAIAGMIITFYPINKKAAYLQLPYFLWVCFATYLNWQIYILNQ
ncbi:MAG: tryptophan-rich sensory protein [Clostridia bacterium]|nr:tryptophan-rich sensory protein [Clostridia bacterium]